MNIDGTEWITLREAEKIIGRSRRQIWRYIYDGSWDTRAVTDEMNRQVTYVKLADILRKKTEIESQPNLSPIPLTEKEIAEDLTKDGERELTIIQQLLERLITNQDYQNNLIKKSLYILERMNLTSLRIFIFVILICVVIIAACSILKVVVE